MISFVIFVYNCPVAAAGCNPEVYYIAFSMCTYLPFFCDSSSLFLYCESYTSENYLVELPQSEFLMFPYDIGVFFEKVPRCDVMEISCFALKPYSLVLTFIRGSCLQ